jgi:uncharacterized protein (DUF885 family)
MRSILRGLAVLVVLALAALAVFAIPTLWGRPWSIEHFYTRVFLETLWAHPMLLSQLRVLEPYGIRWHNDDLDDFSVEFARTEAERVRENLRTLREYPLDDQTPEQRFSTRVLEWYLQVLADGEPYQFHDFPLDQFDGVQNSLPDFLLNVHQIHDAEDARDYVARLAKFDTAIDQVIDATRFRMGRGVVPPRVIVQRVRADVERFLAGGPEASPLVTSFAERVAKLDGVSDGERAELVANARREVAQTVWPAWERLRAFLPELEAKAPEEVGAWALPGGSLYYGWALRYHTTTDLDADTIHELGLREVERIHGEMRAILEAEGYPVADLIVTEALEPLADFAESETPVDAAEEPTPEGEAGPVDASGEPAPDDDVEPEDAEQAAAPPAAEPAAETPDAEAPPDAEALADSEAPPDAEAPPEDEAATDAEERPDTEVLTDSEPSPGPQEATPPEAAAQAEAEAPLATESAGDPEAVADAEAPPEPAPSDTEQTSAEATEAPAPPPAARPSIGDVLRAVHAEPRFRYPESDDARARILADYQAIVDEAGRRMPELVTRLPEAPVRVERVPAFKEAGAAGAYYMPPPLDGSKPGIFYANLRSPGEVVTFAMRTLAYHEAIPGHHLQIALAQELTGVPFFRRVIPFTAYVEGWALYAERIAGEQGWHPTPMDRLGQLVAEVFRAARLVVDTGLHARRWTREQAIDYMLRNTGMPETEVVAEVERYIVLPGQACAYKVGQMRILELRERARAKLGPRFDAKAFNDLVLSRGALPLVLLEEVVDEWLARQ